VIYDRRMSFDAYREHHRCIARRVWFAGVFASVTVGYAVSLASSLLIGGVVALALLVSAELAHRVGRAVKRFPELDNPNVGWAWRGWLLKSAKGTTRNSLRSPR
jgi:hypothetical protein